MKRQGGTQARLQIGHGDLRIDTRSEKSPRSQKGESNVRGQPRSAGERGALMCRVLH